MRRLFTILLLSIPILLFYSEVFTYVDNIAKWDDYDMPIKYCIDFNKADLSERAAMFFGQYGEHRLIPSKILYLSTFYITGGINLRLLLVIGDLQLLVVAFVSIWFLRKYSLKWRFLSFIWCLLIFDLNSFENASMAMNAVGNYGQVAFFFLTLFLYDLNKKWLSLAVFVQILCAYSNGNGQMAMIIIPFFCWLKEDKRKVIASAITGFICVTLNFTFHHTETLPTSLPFDFSKSLTYFIRMSGAHFDFDTSFLVGIAVLGLLIYIFPKKPKEWTDAGIIAILLFVMGTMALATYFRGNMSDSQFQTSRYLIYPQIMIGCLIFFIFRKFKTERQFIVGAIITLLIMPIVYKHNYWFGDLGFQRTAAKAQMYQYFYPDPVRAAKIAKEACDENIYCIEDNR